MGRWAGEQVAGHVRKRAADASGVETSSQVPGQLRTFVAEQTRIRQAGLHRLLIFNVNGLTPSGGFAFRLLPS